MTAVLLLLVRISITTILLLRIGRVMGKQTSKCPPYWYQREPNASLWLVNSRQCWPLIGRLWWHPQFLEKCLILLWVPIFWSAGFITNNYSLWYGAISRHENLAFVIMSYYYHIFISWVLSVILLKRYQFDKNFKTKEYWDDFFWDEYFPKRIIYVDIHLLSL